jgi:hypothetical protein
MNNNSSHWITEAKKHGIDLSRLHQDKAIIPEKLKELNLPRAEVHLFEEDTNEIDQLFKNKSFFCRLIPKNGNVRPYKLFSSTAEELRDFLKKHDLKKYTIMLTEKRPVTHSGVIIAKDNQIVIELVEGDAPNMTHGHKTPYNMQINKQRELKTHPELIPQNIKDFMHKALALIGGPKNPHKGYFEFDVWENTTIIFRNYQSPESAYATLP